MATKRTARTRAPEGTVPPTDPSDPVTATTTPVVEDEVATRLTELGVDGRTVASIKADLGVTTLADLSSVTEADLVGIVGMKPIPARNLAAVLASAKPAPDAVASAAPAINSVSFDDVLPSVLSDDSWLIALKAGGVLKIDQSTVIAAVRAALAYRAGLFGIPHTLSKKMEEYADSNEEQVSLEFFKLLKQLTRRSYAEIFAAIDGMDGTYVTEARKKQLFDRVDKDLWPAIITFQDQLKAWQEAWMGGVGMDLNRIAMFTMATGGGLGALPPGLMQPPDTGVLRDHADAVADAVNRVFRGMGVQIAAALAYDAAKIKETLQNPALPMLIGAANRDQMLRMLGVAVSATYPRLELNLTRYVLSVMQVKDQPGGNEELRYFSTLFMLGSQIPWGELGVFGPTGKVTGIGGARL